MSPVVFMGSPQAALPALRALADHSAGRVVGVFTQPDKTAGRGRKPLAGPVRTEAEALGLPVFMPARMKDEGLTLLERLRPHLVIVCAYGHILPTSVLDLPPLGSYNLHFSSLPRWRGASPLQAAILAGDAVTGVTLQKMVRELDAGPIVAETEPIPIAADDTAGSLGEKLAGLSGQLLRESLPRLLTGDFSLQEQDASQATFCRTISKEAGAVDWERTSAESIERMVRAYTPWPGCHGFLGDKRLGLSVLELVDDGDPGAGGQAGVIQPGGLVAANPGAVRLLEVKPEGKRAMSFKAFLNGTPGALGQRLTPKPSDAGE